MAIPKTKPIYSFDEYLKIDENSELRYEFIHGEIVAMAGSSIAHNRISRNLCFDIHTKLKRKGKNCEPFMSDIRVKIFGENIYYYPDVVVSCEELDNNQKYLSSPIFIAEVLSESTANKDTSEKLFNYLQINSLCYYMVIAQDRVAIQLYERKEDGWLLHLFSQLTDEVILTQMDIQLSVSDLYQGINWEEQI